MEPLEGRIVKLATGIDPVDQLLTILADQFLLFMFRLIAGLMVRNDLDRVGSARTLLHVPIPHGMPVAFPCSLSCPLTDVKDTTSVIAVDVYVEGT